MSDQGRPGAGGPPNDERPAPLVMDIPKAAAYLGVSEHWVRTSCIDGTLPAEMIRGRWVLRRPQMDAWLAGGTAVAGSEPDRRIVFKKPKRRASGPES